ncbi:hypothetical protein D3C85_1733290 [compost metagenome]
MTSEAATERVVTHMNRAIRSARAGRVAGGEVSKPITKIIKVTAEVQMVGINRTVLIHWVTVSQIIMK